MKSRLSIQTFKLKAVVERKADLIQLGKPFAAEKAIVYSLQTFIPSHEEMRTLQYLRGTAIIPASCDWVRVGKPLEDERLVETYIPRADAQRLALALLKLPWHPESYLLGADKSDQCLQLLLGCSSHLPDLMAYTQERIEYLGLAASDKRQLLSAIDFLLPRFEGSTMPLRATLYEMFKLENILKTISHTNQQVNELIGVTTITSPEFLSLMRQSSLRSREALDAAFKIDMRSGILQVPADSGSSQQFHLNVTELYSTRLTSDEVISVKCSLVLIAILRTCLRSAMLDYCFSSIPLIGQVLGLEDVIQIS